MSLQRQTQIHNRNTTCRDVFQSQMKKKGKAVRSEIQLTLTTMLTWTARSWVILAMKIWPWNNFHMCTECSDLGLQIHNLARRQAWLCFCCFPPCLSAAARMVPVHSLRVALSTETLQGCGPRCSWWRWRQKPIAQRLTDSPDHHRLVGPAAWKQTPLLTYPDRTFSTRIWSRLCALFPIPRGKCILALTTLPHFACLCDTGIVQPLSSLQFEQPYQLSNQFSKYKIQFIRIREK